MLKKIKQLITDVLLFLLVITALLLFLFSMASAGTDYRLPTPEEFISSQNVNSVRLITEALQNAFVAGQLQEALNCKCYEVKVSSDPGKIFMRINNDRCK